MFKYTGELERENMSQPATLLKKVLPSIQINKIIQTKIIYLLTNSNYKDVRYEINDIIHSQSSCIVNTTEK